MPVYETVLILKPVLSDPEVAEILEKTKLSITAEGGEVIAQEVWGRRKLTHIIGKAREGVYAFLKYRSGPGLQAKLNHSFKISDTIIRNMTVVAQDRKLREKKKPAAAAAGA